MSRLQKIFAVAAIGAVALTAPRLSVAQQSGDSPDARQPSSHVAFAFDVSGCTSDGYTQPATFTLDFRTEDIAGLSAGDANSDKEALRSRLERATGLQDNIQSTWSNIVRQLTHVQMHAEQSGELVNERESPGMADFDVVKDAIGVTPAGLGWNWRAPAVPGCEP